MKYTMNIINHVMILLVSRLELCLEWRHLRRICYLLDGCVGLVIQQEWMMSGSLRGCCLGGCLAHGAKLRWRDKVRQDLKRFCIAEAGWYCLAQDRTIWRDLCQQGLKKVQNAAPSTMFACDICHRQFRRRQDIARHRC